MVLRHIKKRNCRYREWQQKRGKNRGETMKPKINSTSFGSITVKGKTFENDILIRMSGQIEKRKKKLSKKVYGTSHKISLAEAKYVYEKGADKIIIGTGQTGYVELSKKARRFFEDKDLKAKLLRTPKAIKLWNNSKGNVIAMFHVTC
jgi:hypothetical protein